MAKRIGKTYLLLLTMASFFCSAEQGEIFLYVTDLQDNSFEFMRRQQPFMLHVQTKNMKAGFYPPSEIPGAKTCVVAPAGSSHSTSIVNGVRDEKFSYNYVLRGTKEGEFVLGPIEGVAADGSKVVSNQVKIIISDHALVHKTMQEPFLLELSLDKNTPYVNEQVTLTIRFYYRHNFDQLRIEEPSYADFFVGSKSNYYNSGKKMINGQDFFYKEMTVNLYPKKAGPIELFPARAVFVDGRGSRSMFGGLINSLLSYNSELYSQSIDITVLPLPKYPNDKKVEAVGQFADLSLTLASETEVVGAPVVAKYVISGDGNFEMISAPVLHLPESVRSYSSSDQIVKNQAGQTEKIYEIIIQGSKPGLFQIPKQEFIYFDTRTKSYKTLHTKPLEVTFTGEALPAQEEKQKAEDGQDKDEKTVEPEKSRFDFKDWQIDFIYKDSPIHKSDNLELWETRFLFLLLGLLMALFIWLALLHRQQLFGILLKYLVFQKTCIYISLFFIKKRTNRKLKIKAQKIYNLFSLFFEWHGFDIQKDSGKLFLQSINCSEDEQIEWKNYIDRIMPIIYDQQILDGEKTETNIDSFYDDAKKIFRTFFVRIKEASK